jgi:phosphohistidine phosphatase
MAKSPTAKTLLILRHAHAEAGSPDGSDFNRALSEDGRKEAKRVGKFLRQAGGGADAVLCSAALRALQTAEGVLDAARLKLLLLPERAIYEASAEDLLRAVRATDAKLARLLLVGHNPGIADLLSLLASRDAALSLHFPPATLAAIEFEGDWKSLGPGRGTLRWIVPVKLMD